MRGATRERIDVLASGLLQFPAHLSHLVHTYRHGNPALSQWSENTRANGLRVAVVVMIERFGDIVACSPIAHHLKQTRPNIAVAWVCAKRFSSLAECNPSVDLVFHEESISSWLLTKRLLPRDVDCYELFLDTQRCTWTGIKPQKLRSGVTHTNYLSDGSHLLLAYSRAAGLRNVPDIQPELHLPELDTYWRLRLEGRPVMAVHFDSEDPDRRLRIESATAFVDKALACGWTIVELGLRPIASERNPNVLFPGRTLSLIQQIALLGASDHFSGGFSGFMVCANALSRPATVFIGTFRNFSKITPASGEFWKENWDCVYGPWQASDCPVPVAESHVPLPGALRHFPNGTATC